MPDDLNDYISILFNHFTAFKKKQVVKENIMQSAIMMMHVVMVDDCIVFDTSNFQKFPVIWSKFNFGDYLA